MIIKRVVILILLVVSLLGIGNDVAYAASLCVHPTGAGRCHTSIQAAVDAANDGDRILIRAGTYAEQVLINGKDLTLVGRSGAVIQAPAEMQDLMSPVFGFPGRPLIIAIDANVTIRDLTLDGMNSAENNPFLQGITLINAEGVIHGNTVKDIGFGDPRLPLDENGEPVYEGDAIVVINFGATPRTVTVAENRILNYNNNGILIDAEADPSDPAVTNLTAHVINNTLVASGPNDVIDRWAIFMGGFGFAEPQFSVTGTLRGNRVRDNLTVGEYPLPSIGIVLMNAYNLEVSNNTVENVNIGMAANQVVGAQITRNQFTGASDVFGTSGLLLSGSDSSVFENRFRKLDAGIFLFVEDPQYGSAFNTMLNDNRFDHVAAQVITGSGAPAMMSAARGSSPSPAFALSKLPHR